jgi:putative acetyltransferase
MLGSQLTVTVREESAGDAPAIHEVNRLAFGQPDEADLVDRLRDGGFVIVSLVAVAAEGVVGHILFTEAPMVGPGRTIRGAALAPMAVRPERQRSGIGSALVEKGIAMCRRRGVQAIVVVGHPDYYPRFGFSADLARRHLIAPFAGPAFMAMELIPGVLAEGPHRVRYAPPFGIAD